MKFNYVSKINTYFVLSPEDKSLGSLQQNKDSPTWCFQQNTAVDHLQVEELRHIVTFMDKLASQEVQQ